MSERLGAWAVKRVAHHAGLLALARMVRQRRRAIVMRYHAVTDGPPVEYAAPDICVSASALRLQMAFVRRAYGVVSLDELVDRLHAGGPLPARALAVTFDDGYADNYHLALPVLREFGIPATVYVVTGCLDGARPFWVGVVRTLAHRVQGSVACPGVATPLSVASNEDRERAAKAITRALVTLPTEERHAWLETAVGKAGIDVQGALRGSMMTWAQAREMADAGWTIGAHTVTHGNLTLLPAAEARAEMAESREAIEFRVGRPALHFCYPNTGGHVPSHDERVAALARRAGYRSATTSVPGAIQPGDDPYRLRRLGVSPRLTLVADLAAALERQRLAA